MVSGGTSSIQGSQSARILTLLSGSKLSQQAGGAYVDKIPASVRNAATQAGSKTATLFEQFKNSKIVGKLGSVMGSLQLKAPVHLIDNMITYAIGVVSGLQDMAQVCSICPLFQTNNSHKHPYARTSLSCRLQPLDTTRGRAGVEPVLDPVHGLVALEARSVHRQMLKQAVRVA